MRRSQSFLRWLTGWVSLLLLFSAVKVVVAATLPDNGFQQVASGAVIISEVAWGGTIASPNDEWIELHNLGSDISLDQWRITSAPIPFGANIPNIDVTISNTTTFLSGDYFLLEREFDTVIDTIPADQIYFGPGNLMDDNGETLYLYAPNGSGGYDLIDTANLDGGIWPAGNPDGYGSMERYDDKYYPDKDAIWITNENPDPAGNMDFRGKFIYGTPKGKNWASTIVPVSIVKIISDTPDPSVPNLPVTVSVSVSGGPTIPTGTVKISSTDTNPGDVNCSITLNLASNGIGSCTLVFKNIGIKTITADFTPSSNHTKGTDTHQHEVLNGITTTTQITNINPNPGVVDGNISITVNVTPSSGNLSPTGKVNITGADTNCSITLSNGTGSCNVKFQNVGAKTVTATYLGENAFITSKDTETIDVYEASKTTITSDNPDPSKVNQQVNVVVTVSGGTIVPTGIVEITGATSNCKAILINGTGNCDINFSVSGTKTIKATYSGDGTYGISSDTEVHSVTFVSSTPVPPAPVIQPVIGISEFLPRPGYDWNNDGVVNVSDEFIEIINAGKIDITLSAYRLDDEPDSGSPSYILPSITLKPNERTVFYGSETGILLSDAGDTVRLLRGSTVVDAYTYGPVRFPDQSWCRLPDRMGYWNDPCFPTPNNPNSLTGTIPQPPGHPSAYHPPVCLLPDTTPEEFIYAECETGGADIWNRQYWDSEDASKHLKLNEAQKWETVFE